MDLPPVIFISLFAFVYCIFGSVSMDYAAGLEVILLCEVYHNRVL